MEEFKNIKVSFNTGSIIKVLVVVAIAVALYYLHNFVLVLLTSAVIASSVEPAVNWFAKYKVPRVFGVLAVYVLVLGTILFTLFFLLPPLFEDFSDIAFKVPAEISNFIEGNQSWSTVASLLGNFSTKLSVQEVVNKGVMESPLPGNVFELTKSLFSGLLSFVLIVVISFYLAVQKNGVENFLRIVIPNRYEGYVVDLWNRTEKKIGGWMQGQLLLAVIIGPLVYLGLTLFQVKYALTLAIVASVFEIIPIFGPVLSAVPAVILGFGDSVTLGLIMIGFYLIVHQFENHLLYPLVVKKIIGVNPLVVIIALVVGYELAGFLGIVLSVPIATLLMEIVNDMDKRKHASA